MFLSPIVSPLTHASQETALLRPAVATSEVAQGEGGEVQAWAGKRAAQVGGAGLGNTVLVVLLPLL